jgi:hypothetical protein
MIKKKTIIQGYLARNWDEESRVADTALCDASGRMKGTETGCSN